MERLLSSEALRTSPRSQEFLRYVVHRTLDGQADLIKERNIAIEVFGRGPDYNSAEDSFVRVKASELRRRLQAHYASPPSGTTLRIDLPLGSYVPHFIRWESPAEIPAAPPAVSPKAPLRRRRPWVAGISAGLVLAAAAVLLLVNSQRRNSALDEFWEPILQSRDPLVIFLPIPDSFNTVPLQEGAVYEGPKFEFKNESGETHLFVSAPHKVGLGAAIGAIRFASLCTKTGKSFTLKAGQDFSFADLRNQPAILFGAFSSKWTMEINNEYRFKLISGPDSHVLDSHNPSRSWRATRGLHPGTPSEDYALASRVTNAKSGQTVIIAAGISTFGTQAAAEFLTDPARLEELALRSGRRLKQGSFQVLLQTKVIGMTPTPARIIDAHFW
ncbi:MAG: hypothetical protein HY821_25625 [Acidobacteria bacterium]|nr:hypothetical protein [Acidobacteriota bacterium]